MNSTCKWFAIATNLFTYHVGCSLLSEYHWEEVDQNSFYSYVLVLNPSKRYFGCSKRHTSPLNVLSLPSDLRKILIEEKKQVYYFWSRFISIFSTYTYINITSWWKEAWMCYLHGMHDFQMNQITHKPSHWVNGISWNLHNISKTRNIC